MPVLRAFSSCKFPVQLEVIMALMVSDPQLYLCTACVVWDCCQCISLHCLGSLGEPGKPGKPAWRAWVYRQAKLRSQARTAWFTCCFDSFFTNDDPALPNCISWGPFDRYSNLRTESTYTMHSQRGPCS